MTHSTEETNLTKSLFQRKAIWIPILIILLIIAVGLIWLYTGQINPAKRKVFKAVPLPVAIIGSQIVSSTNLFDRVSLANDLLSENGGVPADLETQILDQLIETKKVEAIAAKNQVSVSAADLDNAFSGVVKQFPNQSEEALAQELQNNYGLSLAMFKNEVLRESVTTEKLSLWFNSQESLNPEAYTSARDLLSQLDNGGDFAEVAKKFSEDPASQAFAGDSGFVAYSDLLPEFQTAVENLALNNNVIVASRYGIHILRLNAIEETGEGDSKEKSYNLQQIFIAPNDFNRWLEAETAGMKSWKLI